MKPEDKINAYLSDLLNNSEKYEFEEWLKQSEELRKEYYRIKEELKRLRDKSSPSINEFYINKAIYLAKNRIYERRSRKKIAKKFQIVFASFLILFSIWQSYSFLKHISIDEENLNDNLNYEEIEYAINKYMSEDFFASYYYLNEDNFLSYSLYEYYFNDKKISDEEIKDMISFKDYLEIEDINYVNGE